MRAPSHPTKVLGLLLASIFAGIARWGSSAPTGHLGVGPAFVHKHQPSRIYSRQLFRPVRPLFSHVGTILLGGVQRFFIGQTPSSESATLLPHPFCTTPMFARTSFCSSRLALVGWRSAGIGNRHKWNLWIVSRVYVLVTRASECNSKLKAQVHDAPYSERQ